MEPLNRGAILERLDTGVRGRVSLELFDALTSTNQYLLDTAPAADRKLSVCLAESQSAGRGRRGRTWHSPARAGLYLSAGWQFLEAPQDLAALSLAVGVIARRAIQAETDLAIELKWPNDLIWASRKLGGILVEVKATRQGPCYVVAGLGLNVAMPEVRGAERARWPTGAVDLREATAGEPPSRVALAAVFIEALMNLMEGYTETGFAPYHAEFVAADFLRGREVAIDATGSRVLGKAVSVEPDGVLVLQTSHGMQRVVGGDVSVRSLS